MAAVHGLGVILLLAAEGSVGERRRAVEPLVTRRLTASSTRT